MYLKDFTCDSLINAHFYRKVNRQWIKIKLKYTEETTVNEMCTEENEERI